MQIQRYEKRDMGLKILNVREFHKNKKGRIHKSEFKKYKTVSNVTGDSRLDNWTMLKKLL